MSSSKEVMNVADRLEALDLELASEAANQNGDPWNTCFIQVSNLHACSLVDYRHQNITPKYPRNR